MSASTVACAWVPLSDVSLSARDGIRPSAYDAGMHLASLAQLGDCEAIHGGSLAQPVNAWSSLAFSVVGLAIATSGGAAEGRERSDRVVFGLLLVATGIGSFLFHGAQPPSGQFLHDVTFLAALWFLVTANLTGAFGVSHRNGWIIEGAGIAVIAAVVGLAPGATNILAAILAVGLIVADFVLRRESAPSPRWYAAALAALGIGVAMFLAGRTGSPLCDSTGLWQAHAGWHVLAAFFLGSYFFATTPARTRA